MLHAGLDLSRNRVDVCVLRDEGELVEFSAPADEDGLVHLYCRVAGRREPVRCVVESMTGARFCSRRRCTRSATPPTPALPAHEAPSRQAARRQGRAGRDRPAADQGDLAHADLLTTLQSPGSGRRRCSSGGLTALFGIAHPEPAPMTPGPPARRR
jgi:hypothetical protein